ncbi:MAG: ribulose bisphosphate carboxylase small subunit, partial [Anaerolineae bacterium]|nr:ribulose bisphosphate carboxylase small subunit [Anaerolineae bacterium]
MSDIQDYPYRMDSPESQRFETFSYLPEMDASQIRKQLEYMVEQGWNCAVEHVEPARAGDRYWCMWKLPLFGESDVTVAMNEINACHNAN